MNYQLQCEFIWKQVSKKEKIIKSQAHFGLKMRHGCYGIMVAIVLQFVAMQNEWPEHFIPGINRYPKSVCCDICLTTLFYNTLRLKLLQHIQAIIHTIYSNYGKNRKYDVHLATSKIQQKFESEILLNSFVKLYPLKLTKVVQGGHKNK